RLLPNTAVANIAAATVTPYDMTGIHAGMSVMMDAGTVNQEVVNVQVAGPNSFTVANMAKAHGPNSSITPVRSTELQYLGQPDNFTVPGSYISQGAGTGVTITFPPPPPGNPPVAVNLAGIVTPGPAYLVLRGGTEVHLIQNPPAPTFIPANPPANPNA